MPRFAQYAKSEVLLGLWIQRMKGKSKATQNAYARIASILERRIKRAFIDQGRPAGAWAPRAIPNIAGILMDLKKGARTLPQRRFEARPAGIDTGKLRASVHSTILENGVEVGSTLDYARKFSKGEPSSIQIDEQMKKNLAKILKKIPDKRAQLGFLFNLNVFEVKPPARPFISITLKDIADFKKILNEEITRP